jgi:hypothetical protein
MWPKTAHGEGYLTFGITSDRLAALVTKIPGDLSLKPLAQYF